MSLEHLRNPGDFLERWTHHPDLFPKADRQGYGCRALRPALLLPRPRAPCQAPPPHPTLYRPHLLQQPRQSSTSYPVPMETKEGGLATDWFPLEQPAFLEPCP